MKRKNEVKLQYEEQTLPFAISLVRRNVDGKPIGKLTFEAATGAELSEWYDRHSYRYYGSKKRKRGKKKRTK